MERGLDRGIHSCPVIIIPRRDGVRSVLGFLVADPRTLSNSSVTGRLCLPIVYYEFCSSDTANDDGSRSCSPVRAQCKSASVAPMYVGNRRISVAVRKCGTATTRYGKTYVEWKAIGFATRRGDRARSSAQRGEHPRIYDLGSDETTR